MTKTFRTTNCLDDPEASQKIERPLGERTTLKDSPFHVVLFQPEIPPNTGNIIRLCANTGTQLHLIHPCGFELDDRKLRRAGLDYREWANVREYDCYEQFIEEAQIRCLYALSTQGSGCYAEKSFQPGDGFMFGPETRGLPDEILAGLPAGNRLFVPMVFETRSLNLSNTVSIVLYEAWRQQRFTGSGRQRGPFPSVLED
ncbi:MAG: tRNA (cytidine(34)-2'-O)-methyltransferase [Methylococcales bacterium]|nr:tRNA (cytidine(34)-2'-O)-methyltransferase [Methylococcales bacterium]